MFLPCSDKLDFDRHWTFYVVLCVSWCIVICDLTFVNLCAMYAPAVCTNRLNLNFIF